MAKRSGGKAPSGLSSEAQGGEDESKEPRQPKNIILCSDGTGNSGGKARGTNVWALFNAVWRQPNAEGKSPERRQTASYDDGVGTQKFIVFKILGGALGLGYFRNIRQLYKALVLAYEPGDSIYLFGFSRGAYTVRCLAGLILKCGILNRHEFDSSEKLNKAVRNVFRVYRHSYKSLGGALIRLFRPGEAKTYESHKKEDRIHDLKDGEVATNIRFIGVWDTVDAVGLPFDSLADLLNLLIQFRFRDHDLNRRVVNACHAISIDDERRTFWPVLWNEEGEKNDRIEQVWFAGVHTNVGGGYPKNQMALVTLDWMMEKAEAAGLEFYPNVRDEVRAAANAHGKLYDSRAGLAAYYRYHPRDFEKILRDPGAGVKVDLPKIHYSVLRRAARATGDYAPANLPNPIEVVYTHSEDKDYAAHLKMAFDATAKARQHDLKAVDRLVKRRRGLYSAFVLFSALIAIFGALFKWGPLADEVPDSVDLPREVESIFTLGSLVVPDFVSSVFGPLISYLKVNWGYALTAALFFLILVGCKWLWEGQSRHRALNAWRAFREYRLAPKAS